MKAEVEADWGNKPVLETRLGYARSMQRQKREQSLSEVQLERACSVLAARLATCLERVGIDLHRPLTTENTGELCGANGTEDHARQTQDLS